MTPRTAAGLALLKQTHGLMGIHDAILAIEAQAATPDAAGLREREEFPQRPEIGLSLDPWRKTLPPDFPLYNAHGDYIGRLTELHQDVDHLSCLGCGQIGTPSTFNATTGIYLCAERCVPALRAALAAPAPPAGLDVEANLDAVHALATILHQRESAGQQRCGPGSTGCRMRHRMDATSVLGQVLNAAAYAAAGEGEQ